MNRFSNTTREVAQNGRRGALMLSMDIAHPDVEEFIRRHKTTIVLEINRDGQLYGILRRELPNDIVTNVHSVAYSDGLPPRARIYANLISEKLKEVNE